MATELTPYVWNQWNRVSRDSRLGLAQYSLNHADYFIVLLEIGPDCRPGRDWSYTIYRTWEPQGIASVRGGYGRDRDMVAAAAVRHLAELPGATLDQDAVKPIEET